ncbi:unnamed protein product [Cunninghamella echinulata]
MVLKRQWRNILSISVVVFMFWSLYINVTSTYSSKTSSVSIPIEQHQPKIYIAANLYNNEKIIDNWTYQIKKLIQYYGTNNIYVSIFENGSTDNTRNALREFKEYLLDAQVHHTIILDDRPKYFIEARITRLAELRNIVLQPLRQMQKEKNNDQELIYDKILFLNDIWFNWKDAVELISSRNGDYDAICSMDFYGEYYDMFATREINGKWLGSGNYPYFEDKKSRELLKKKNWFLFIVVLVVWLLITLLHF